MHARFRWFLACLTFLAVCLLIGPPAEACNVPMSYSYAAANYCAPQATYVAVPVYAQIVTAYTPVAQVAVQAVPAATIVQPPAAVPVPAAAPAPVPVPAAVPMAAAAPVYQQQAIVAQAAVAYAPVAACAPYTSYAAPIVAHAYAARNVIRQRAAVEVAVVRQAVVKQRLGIRGRLAERRATLQALRATRR